MTVCAVVALYDLINMMHLPWKSQGHIYSFHFEKGPFIFSTYICTCTYFIWIYVFVYTTVCFTHWHFWLHRYWDTVSQHCRFHQMKENDMRMTCWRECDNMPCTLFPWVKKANTFSSLQCFVYPPDIFPHHIFCPIYLLCAYSNKSSKSLAWLPVAALNTNTLSFPFWELK